MQSLSAIGTGLSTILVKQKNFDQGGGRADHKDNL